MYAWTLIVEIPSPDASRLPERNDHFFEYLSPKVTFDMRVDDRLGLPYKELHIISDTNRSVKPPLTLRYRRTV